MTAQEDAWKAWCAAASHFWGELVRHAALEEGVVQFSIPLCKILWKRVMWRLLLQDLCEGSVREASPSPESELLCTATQAPLLGAPDDGVPPDVHTRVESVAEMAALRFMALHAGCKKL